MNELLFIIPFVSLMLSWPFLLQGKGRWYWFFTMLGCMVWFGIMEAAAKFGGGDGLTLSSYFWIFNASHPVLAWIAVGMMGLAWAFLIHHLIHKKKIKK